MTRSARAEKTRRAAPAGRVQAWLRESSCNERTGAGAVGSVALSLAGAGLDQLTGGAVGAAAGWVLDSVAAAVALLVVLLGGGLLCLRLARPGADVIAGLLLGWLAQIVLLVTYAVVVLSSVADL